MSMPPERIWAYLTFFDQWSEGRGYWSAESLGDGTDVEYVRTDLTPPVSVKPLDWQEPDPHDCYSGPTARTLGGTYCIDFNDGWWAFVTDEANRDGFEAHAEHGATDEDAIEYLKSECQRDFDGYIRNTLTTDLTPSVAEAATSADHHQRTGAAIDIINEALNSYRGLMLDDDYDAQGALDRIMSRMSDRLSALTGGEKDAD